MDIQSTYKSLQDQLEDRHKVETETKEKHDREISNLRNQNMVEKQRCNNLELELEKLSELKAKHLKLIQGHELTISAQNEFKNDLEKSHQSTELLRKELDFLQADIQNQRDAHQKGRFHF